MQRKHLILGMACVVCVFLTFFWRSLSNEGVTPLMVAAKAGDIETVQEIVSDGGNLDERSAYGWTALMFAAWQGHEEIVRTMVEAGADTNLASGAVPTSFSTTADYLSTTALYEAISNENLEIAHYLLESGTDVDKGAMAIAGWRGNPRLLSAMVEKGGLINGISGNQFYRTALSVAAEYGKNENLKWLLSNGADPNLPIPHSSNLKEAVRGLNPEAVLLLIEGGAEVDAPNGSGNTTALREAVSAYSGNKHSQKIQVVEVLLAKGANPKHVRDAFDTTLLERVEISIQREIESSRESEQSEEVRQRHRRSLATKRAILDLLRSHAK